MPVKSPKRKATFDEDKADFLKSKKQAVTNLTLNKQELEQLFKFDNNKFMEYMSKLFASRFNHELDTSIDICPYCLINAACARFYNLKGKEITNDDVWKHQRPLQCECGIITDEEVEKVMMNEFRKDPKMKKHYP
jgi:hypothetical protein